MKTSLQTPADFKKSVERKNQTPLGLACAELELTANATFNGTQTDAQKWEHYLWNVRIEMKGKSVHSLPYHCGMAHAWQKPASSFSGYGEKRNPVIPAAPHIADVIHSLLSDVSCAGESFEDFCANMGVDTDSRKALETYLACQESGNALRKFLKPDQLAKLSDAARGY